jgi:hypothetical protein
MKEDDRISFLDLAKSDKSNTYTVKKIRSVTLMQIIHDQA